MLEGRNVTGGVNSLLARLFIKFMGGLKFGSEHPRLS